MLNNYNDVLLTTNELLDLFQKNNESLNIDNKRVPRGFFTDREDIKKVTLLNGFLSIGEDSFKNCKNLEEIVIPDGVIEIENNAFRGCKKLKKVVLPESIQKVGRRSFLDCKSLDPYDILREFNKTKKYKNSIPAGLFIEREDIKIFNVPNNIEKIENDAFSCCLNLKEISIPKSVKSIEKYAFVFCSNLKKVNFEDPSTLTNLGISVFGACKSLDPYKLLEEVNKSPRFKEKIPDGFFSCRDNLENFIVPEHIKFIGEYAFMHCFNLKNIVFPKNLFSIEKYAFNDCTSLKKISLPNDLKRVAERAFYNCSELEEVEFPFDLKFLDPDAFEDCNLNEKSIQRFEKISSNLNLDLDYLKNMLKI